MAEIPVPTLDIAEPSGDDTLVGVKAGQLRRFPTASFTGGAALSDAPPAGLGAASAGAGTAASRDDHVHPMPTAADIGAATSEQGSLADSAVQPEDLGSAAGADVEDFDAAGAASSALSSAQAYTDAARRVPAVRSWAGGTLQHPFFGALQGTRQNITVVQDRLYYLWGFAFDNLRVSNPRCELQAAQAGATARCGIYEWDTDLGQPGALVVDWGTADLSSPGTLTFSNGSAVADLVPDQPYAIAFIAGGGASAPAFYYQPFAPAFTPNANLGVSTFVLSVFDAGEASQRTGGLDTATVAADLAVEATTNAAGMRNFIILDVEPTP